MNIENPLLPGIYSDPHLRPLFSSSAFDERVMAGFPHVPYPALSIFSLNVNKANYIGHSVLNSCVGYADLILFQEPWKGKIGSLRSDTTPEGTSIFGMVHQRSWQQYVPVPAEASGDNPARVSAYVTKKANGPLVIQRTDLVQHPDILVLEVRVSGRSPFLILNVYNDANCSALSTLTTLTLPPLPTFITGDFNLHSPMWSQEHVSSSASAEVLIEWMSLHGFTLLNNPGEMTFSRGGQQSVLDLTWANRLILEKRMVREWAVRSDLNICSDHFPTIWFIPTSRSPPPQDHQAGRFRFEEKKASEWVTHIERSLTDVFTPALLESTDIDLQELDRVIGSFHTALENASVEVLRNDPALLRPNPWFTKEVAAAIGAARAAHRLARLANRRDYICSQDAESHFCSSRRKL